MIRIFLLLAIIILISLAVARWVLPWIYLTFKRDSFKIRKDLDDVDDNY